jgi:hypothetical protein
MQTGSLVVGKYGQGSESMPNGDLEQRVAALEGQAGGGGGGQQAGGESVEAFLAGALTAYAASQQGGAQGIAGGQAGGQQGIFGWNPTKYDSFFWCKSRFMCNPQSLSCLC